MYVSTFARQGISVAQNELEKLSSIVDFAEKNHGYVVIVRDSKSVASAATGLFNRSRYSIQYFYIK